MTRSEKACELHKMGYNCAQAVFAAYADEFGMDMDTALRISSSFGAGFGKLQEVCGAFSGMAMILGMREGNFDPKVPSAKMEHYARVRALADQFKAENGSIVCAELLGLDRKEPVTNVAEARTEQYYAKRPCAMMVQTAASIFAEYLESLGK